MGRLRGLIVFIGGVVLMVMGLGIVYNGLRRLVRD